MKRNFVLPAMAGLGLAIAAFVMVDDNRPAEERPLVTTPSESPFAFAIAGVGIVEADTGNVNIGTPVSGVVTDVYVKVGDRVSAGDALFKIDDRDLNAELLTATARSELAAAAVLKPTHRLNYLRQMRKTDPSSVSTRDLTDVEDDLALAEATLNLANMQVKKIQTDIAILTIRAPTAGEVLQVHTRPGEHVEAGINAQPILLFGRSGGLHVRVDIDEADIWRFEPGTNAVAFERGNPARKIPLQYEYTERYVIPKTSLTGQSTERTDVRVLQAIYGIEGEDPAVYAGQQLDVFIETVSGSEQGAGQSS
jgi:multidrug efflux pump subunit AcrA (membrane-fusion protein)